MKVFSHRNKIHGITFHHRTSQRRIKTKSTLRDYFNLNHLITQINEEYPDNLDKENIAYLMCDQGRNEIHTLVSLCTDNISKWDGIVKTMDRCFTFANLEKKEFTLNYFLEQDDCFIAAIEELEVYLEAKKLLDLWKHKLKILEMIVEAQGSLRFVRTKY